MSKANMTLAAFVGAEFDLTACSTAECPISSTEAANMITFTLDGATWQAVEDPEDGYRSSMRNISRVSLPPSNSFPPCRVRGEWEEDADGQENEVMVFRSVLTDKPVIEVGTANTNDYYPCFVGRFMPENLDVNTAAAVELRKQRDKELEAEVAKRDALGWGTY